MCARRFGETAKCGVRVGRIPKWECRAELLRIVGGLQQRDGYDGLYLADTSR